MLEYDKNEENEEIGRESEILEKEEKEFKGKRLNLKPIKIQCIKPF